MPAGDGAGRANTYDLDAPVWPARIACVDVALALQLGWRDFRTAPGPGLVIAAILTAFGLALAAMVLRHGAGALLVPLTGGFALVGPFAAVGHYRVSRRLELGLATPWWRTPALVAGPRAAAVLGLGLGVTALMFAWLGAAALLMRLMLPPMGAPDDLALALLATPDGHRLLLVGSAVGAAFAFPVFAVSVAAFAMLVDRDVDIVTAAVTSCAAVARNPGPMALWACVVATTLVLAALPVMLGLLVALPVLGHATWHLYRRLIVS